jgi:hypothetical protein
MEPQSGPITNGSLEVLLDSDGFDQAFEILKPYLQPNLPANDIKEVRL